MTIFLIDYIIIIILYPHLHHQSFFNQS